MTEEFDLTSCSLAQQVMTDKLRLKIGMGLKQGFLKLFLVTNPTVKFR